MVEVGEQGSLEEQGHNTVRLLRQGPVEEGIVSFKVFYFFKVSRLLGVRIPEIKVKIKTRIAFLSLKYVQNKIVKKLSTFPIPQFYFSLFFSFSTFLLLSIVF